MRILEFLCNIIITPFKWFFIFLFIVLLHIVAGIAYLSEHTYNFVCGKGWTGLSFY